MGNGFQFPRRCGNLPHGLVGRSLADCEALRLALKPFELIIRSRVRASNPSEEKASSTFSASMRLCIEARKEARSVMENRVSDNDDEITVAAFERWLAIGRPGTKFVYHRGHLATDREEVIMLPALGSFVHVFHEPYHTLAKTAWHHYVRGDVVLVQKKLAGDRGFEYLAIKRRQRRRK